MAWLTPTLWSNEVYHMKEDAGKHTEVSHWRGAWEKRPSPSQQEEGCASGCAQLRAGDSGMHRSPPQLTNTVHEEKAQEAPKTMQKGERVEETTL